MIAQHTQTLKLFALGLLGVLFSMSAKAQFNDGFEGNLDKWYEHPNNKATINLVKGNAAVGNQHLQMVGNSTFSQGLIGNFTKSQPEEISWYFRNDTISDIGSYVVIGSSGGSILGEVFIYFNKGYLVVVGKRIGTTATDRVIVPVAVKQWHHVRLALDWDQKHYYLYLNDTLQGSLPVGLRNGGSELDQIHLFNFTATSTGNWDEIKIGKDGCGTKQEVAFAFDTLHTNSSPIGAQGRGRGILIEPKRDLTLNELGFRVADTGSYDIVIRKAGVNNPLYAKRLSFADTGYQIIPIPSIKLYDTAAYSFAMYGVSANTKYHWQTLSPSSDYVNFVRGLDCNTCDSSNVLANAQSNNFTGGFDLGLVEAIEVIGNGNLIANNDITPSLNDFTLFDTLDTYISTADTHTFQISNTSNDILTLSSSAYVLSGGDSTSFSILNTGTDTANPCDPIQLQVVFLPKGLGQKETTLKISYASNATISFRLKGIATTNIVNTCSGLGDTLTANLEAGWLTGSNTVNSIGVYGTKGVAGKFVEPPAVQDGASWVDTAGNLYVFGGVRISPFGYYNSIMKWDGTQWTWISGDSTVNSSGVYGTKGSGKKFTGPGARTTFGYTTDSDNNFWIYGGSGFDSKGSRGYLNDLWKWDGTVWTWISGDSTFNSKPTYGTKGTAAATNMPGGVRGLRLSIDSKGNAWVYGGYGFYNIPSSGGGHRDELWKFDGANWTFVSGTGGEQMASFTAKGQADASNHPSAREAHAQWLDCDDNIFIFGGAGSSPSGSGHLSDLWKFDGANWTFVHGDTAISVKSVSGTKGVAGSNNTPGAHSSSSFFKDNDGSFWLMSGLAEGSSGRYNDLWRWSDTAWTWMGGEVGISNLAQKIGKKGDLSTNYWPGGKYRNPAAYDAKRAKLYLYGGNGYGASFGDQGIVWLIQNSNITIPPLSLSISSTNTTCNNGSDGAATVAVLGGTRPYTYAWQGLSTTDSFITNVPAGTYYVTVTDSNSNTITDSVEITEPTAILPGNITGNDVVCAGVAPNKITELNAASGGTGTISYQWQMSTDNLTWTDISGATSSEYQPSGTSGSTWYRRTATDANSCEPVASNTVKITINGQPRADFSAMASCTNQQTQFTDRTVLASGNIASFAWSFGDRGTSTQQNPINVYSKSGTYTVSLKVTSDSGCVDSTSETVSVNPVPSVDFTATTECEGTATDFTNKSKISSGTLSYEWDLGDKNSSTATEPNHTYTNAGYYNVQLTASSNAGCVDSVLKTVQVKRVAQPNFSATSVCEGNSTSFTNLSTNAKTYSWDFGNSSGTSSKQNPTYQYSNSGTYTAILTATSADGCSDTAHKNVTVYGLPTASFSANTVCLNQTTNFTNNSSGASHYQWIFGNGTSSNKTAPSLVYGTAGNYTVELTATTANGCTDVTTNTVTVNALPEVNFSTADVCQSDALVTTNNTTGASSYAWSFGDGNTSSQTAPTHNYNTYGQYTVRLIATTSNGCVDSAKTSINAWAEPQPAFAASNVCLGKNMAFSNNSSIANGTMTYTWDLGDGTTTSNPAPSHGYQQFGPFAVQLVATTNRGCKDSTTSTVMVYNVPNMAFNAPNVCFGDTFKVENRSQIASVYHWDLGDGTTSSAVNDTFHFYQEAGNYSVQLTGSTMEGCTDSISKNITIYAKPIAEYNMDDVCDEETVQFANTSYNASITANNWAFGDGNSSTRINPKHTYATHGTYNTTLMVSTNDGCSDTLSQDITVHPNPVAGFSNSTECDYDTTIFTNSTTIASGSNRYHWEFGTGDTSSQTAPQFYYENAGVYKVDLLVTSNHGCTDEATALITVHPSPLAGMVLANNCEAEFSQLTDNSNLSKGQIISYNWDLGDGNSSAAQNPSHLYSQEGIYAIQLVVTSDQACTDTANGSFEVYQKPTAAFNVADVCFKEVSAFVDASSDATDYLFDFGDKWGISTLASPEYTYEAAGSYDATLYVTSKDGCRDTLTKTVTIHGLPAARFSVNHHCFQEDFTPQDKSLGSPDTWNWSFGDGNTSNDQNPTYNYTSADDYSVKLEVIDANNCVDSLRKMVQVWPLPTPDIRPDTIVSKGYEVQLWAKGGVAYKWSPVELLDRPLQADPIATVVEDQTYTVTVANEFGCTRDTFVNLRIREDYTLEPSNIMTPDGNGQNDNWFVEKAQYYNDVEVIVFDRWGRIVYQNRSYDNSWEGTSTSGEPLPDGAYYYVIKVPTEREEYKGSITIFR